MGETRTCRDWSAVAKWVDAETIEWLRFMGVVGSESIETLETLGNHIGDELWRSTHHHAEP